MSFVRVKQPFSTGTRVYVVGTVLDASDPVVGPRPELFDRIEDIAAPVAEVVEQATAAPGEKRTRTRTPKAPAAPKPLAEA